MCTICRSLLQVPRAQPHRDLLMGVGGRCQMIIRKACPQTIVGKVFGEHNTPSTLSTSFADFETQQAHCSRYQRVFLFLPSSPFSSIGSQKSLPSLTHPFLISITQFFLFYFIELVIVLYIYIYIQVKYYLLNIKQ